jgi:hypothetical protein
MGYGMQIVSSLETSGMKKILIAATAVGATIAGLILYSRKRNSEPKQIQDAAKDAYKTMNDGLGKVERGAMSMG